MGCGIKACCPLVGPGPAEVSSVENPYLHSFEEKHGKLRTAWSISVTGDRIRHHLSTSFEGRNTRPLVMLEIGRNFDII